MDNEPITIGTSLQIMIDTIGQDALLDYLNATNQSYNYSQKKQFLQRLKKREEFNATTFKNLADFNKYFTDWTKWVLDENFANGMTLNYIDRILCSYFYASYFGTLKKYGMFVSVYSICNIFFELFNFFKSDSAGSSDSECIRQSLACLDYFDSDSHYLSKTTVFGKVFKLLDKMINDKKKFYEEWNTKIYTLIDKDTDADLKHQIDRWIKDEDIPKWKFVKAICSKKSMPDKTLFREEKQSELLWSVFRRYFLTAYLIKNHFNSLIKHNIITQEQKEHIIEGIRHMFRFAFYQNEFCKADAAEDFNFMFSTLLSTFNNNMYEYFTLNSDMPIKGMKMFFDIFIPSMLKQYPVLKFGLQQIFNQEDIERLILEDF